MSANISLTLNDISDFSAAPAITVTGENSITVDNLTLNLDFATSARGEWVIASGLNWSSDFAITVNGAAYEPGSVINNISSGNRLTISLNDQNNLVLSSTKDDRLYIVYSDDDSYLASHERFKVEDNFYYGVINAANSNIETETFYLCDPENSSAKVQLDIEADAKLRYTTFDINNCAEVTINVDGTDLAGITGSAAGKINLNNAVLFRAVNTAGADVTISGSGSAVFDGIAANNLTISDGRIYCTGEQITANYMNLSGGLIYGNITISGQMDISGGRIFGDLKAEDLVIKGGTFAGDVIVNNCIEVRQQSSAT